MFRTLPIIIALVAGAYFLIKFRRMSFMDYFNKPTWLPWAVATVLTIICIYFAQSIFSLSAAIMVFLLYSFLLTDSLNLIFKRCIKKEATERKWTRLFRSGVVPFAFTVIITTISYFTATNVLTTNYSLKISKPLGEDKINISMISDLHLGTTMNLDKLKKYCDKIQKSNPDIVVLDGDIFDERTPKGYMEGASQVFGQIKSTYGVYYVFGNHDIGSHGSNPNFTKQDITKNLAANKINILEDETKLINNQFYIVGRKAASFSRSSDRKSMEDLLKVIDKNKFILLLDHQPLELEKASQNGIDLQLAGHTHGGQIWPSGLLSDIFHTNELNYGYKKIKDYQVIVSSGIGGLGYPLRLGSKAEIVQIQLSN
jgi:predicted MPP superfamily phosphohydrolase